jgi:prepilin-type processing-associated H-X9-DG protein
MTHRTKGKRESVGINSWTSPRSFSRCGAVPDASFGDLRDLARRGDRDDRGNVAFADGHVD